MPGTWRASHSQHATSLHEELTQSVFAMQTYEGGLGGEHGNEAHGGYTFCGLAALMLVGRASVLDLPSLLHWAVHRQVSPDPQLLTLMLTCLAQGCRGCGLWRYPLPLCGYHVWSSGGALLALPCKILGKELPWYPGHLQGAMEGGFMGRTNKLVDGCYSFWQGGLFPLLQRLWPDYLAQTRIPGALTLHDKIRPALRISGPLPCCSALLLIMWPNHSCTHLFMYPEKGPLAPGAARLAGSAWPQTHAFRRLLCKAHLLVPEGLGSSSRGLMLHILLGECGSYPLGIAAAGGDD